MKESEVHALEKIIFRDAENLEQFGLQKIATNWVFSAKSLHFSADSIAMNRFLANLTAERKYHLTTLPDHAIKMGQIDFFLKKNQKISRQLFLSKPDSVFFISVLESSKNVLQIENSDLPFFKSMLRLQPSDFRLPVTLVLDTISLNRISINQAGESVFFAEKKDSIWTFVGDKTLCVPCLFHVVGLMDSLSFADDFNSIDETPIFQTQVTFAEGGNIWGFEVVKSENMRFFLQKTNHSDWLELPAELGNRLIFGEKNTDSLHIWLHHN